MSIQMPSTQAKGAIKVEVIPDHLSNGQKIIRSEEYNF